MERVLHAETLNVLRPFCGPCRSVQLQQKDDILHADIHEEYGNMFVGVGKLKGYQLKLHVDKDTA